MVMNGHTASLTTHTIFVLAYQLMGLHHSVVGRRLVGHYLYSITTFHLHLSQIKLLYGLEAELALCEPKSEFPKGYYSHPECK